MIPCEKGAKYIGLRYVPILADPIEWTSNRTYEHFTIVKHKGNSYTSKVDVPAGIDINNSSYWVMTADFNAQIEQYRQELEYYVQDKNYIKNYVGCHTYSLSNYGVCPQNSVEENTKNFNKFFKDTVLISGDRVVLPAGEYNVGELIIPSISNIEIDFYGSLIYHGINSCITIGSNTEHSMTNTINLFNITTINSQQGTGVKLINLYYCSLTVNKLEGFNINLHLLGINTLGCSLCRITPNLIANGVTNVLFEASNNGWCNSNTVVGGEIRADGSVNIKNQVHLDFLADSSTSRPNNMTFLGTSFEGSPSSLYCVTGVVSFSSFIGCRFEGVKPFNLSSLSISNVIVGGYGYEYYHLIGNSPTSSLSFFTSSSVSFGGGSAHSNDGPGMTIKDTIGGGSNHLKIKNTSNKYTTELTGGGVLKLLNGIALREVNIGNSSYSDAPEMVFTQYGKIIANYTTPSTAQPKGTLCLVNNPNPSVAPLWVNIDGTASGWKKVLYE